MNCPLLFSKQTSIFYNIIYRYLLFSVLKNNLNKLTVSLKKKPEKLKILFSLCKYFKEFKLTKL